MTQQHQQSWQIAYVVFAGTAAFSVSGTIAVSGFKRLWSYQCQRQIVAMERKELSAILTDRVSYSILEDLNLDYFRTSRKSNIQRATNK